jgi:tetratricopeptide (TPR) repeat protein
MNKYLSLIAAACLVTLSSPILAKPAQEVDSAAVPGQAESANVRKVMKEAYGYYVNNDFTKALYMYRAAEAMAPESAECRRGEGMSLLAMGRKREALGAYREATKLDPLDQESLADSLRLEAELDTAQTHDGLALGGPRFGALFLTSGDYDQIQQQLKKSYGQELQNPTMSLFGWQFEYRFLTTDSGWTALSEFIPLVAGLDQGLALPSVTWLMGVRRESGLEFAAGPNFAIDGVAYVVALGYTLNAGQLNFPLDVTYAMGKDANRLALSVGFNL